MDTLFSIRHLAVTPRHQCILNVPELDLPVNTHIAIIGPNGAGKSTLLRALLGLYGGEAIRLHNECVSSQVKQGKIAWVGQHGQYDLPLSVTEYVQLGCDNHAFWSKAPKSLSRIQHLLQEFDLGHLAHRRISHLSGGEQQRANIVRALLQDAPVLLLDEPCNHLDIRHQHRLMHYLKQEHAAFSVVMVLHDLTMAAHYADFIVLMNQGQIVATGDADTVMQESLLSEVYQWPIRRMVLQNEVFFQMANTEQE